MIIEGKKMYIVCFDVDPEIGNDEEVTFIYDLEHDDYSEIPALCFDSTSYHINQFKFRFHEFVGLHTKIFLFFIEDKDMEINGGYDGEYVLDSFKIKEIPVQNWREVSYKDIQDDFPRFQLYEKNRADLLRYFIEREDINTEDLFSENIESIIRELDINRLIRNE